MSDAWYSQVPAHAPLTQGDLIPDCPVMNWNPDPTAQLFEKAEVEVTTTEVVVMTQACDLEQRKVRDVVACACYPLTQYRVDWERELRGRSQNPTPKAWASFLDDVANGFCWNLSLLNAYQAASSGTETSLRFEHRVVDFHEIYTVPRVFLEQLLAMRGTPRHRLRPPYREHLSQAFARFFMRVGLPVDIDRPWRGTLRQA
jgi:hypothetical protein